MNKHECESIDSLEKARQFAAKFLEPKKMKPLEETHPSLNNAHYLYQEGNYGILLEDVQKHTVDKQVLRDMLSTIKVTDAKEGKVTFDASLFGKLFDLKQELERKQNDY